MDYRKPIHDKLITDFTALTFDGTAINLFTEVKKLFVVEPEDLPVCRITSTGLRVEIDGNTHNTRLLGFVADTFDSIPLDNISQEDAEKRIDRLSNIEDSVLAYLSKLPNNIEHEVGTIHIYDMQVEQTSYQYQSGERGIEVMLSIPFTLKLSITPQLL